MCYYSNMSAQHSWWLGHICPQQKSMHTQAYKSKGSTGQEQKAAQDKGERRR
jgi:hypothetical protein